MNNNNNNNNNKIQNKVRTGQISLRIFFHFLSIAIYKRWNPNRQNLPISQVKYSFYLIYYWIFHWIMSNNSTETPKVWCGYVFPKDNYMYVWQWDTTYFSSSDWSTLDFLLTDTTPCSQCRIVKHKKRQKAGFPIMI